MASFDVQRKLTAIPCADIVGYSRLMGDDEAATLRFLTDYRKVFFDYIEKFRGRIVNAPGDSIFAEFGSVVVNSYNHDLHSYEVIRRAKVIGSWLVQATTGAKLESGEELFAESMAFVPDPYYNWEIEVDAKLSVHKAPDA